MLRNMLPQNCSIKDFKESVFPTVYLFIFILGIVGHLLSMHIFFSVWRKKRSLTTVNLFMVNLLVSDLMLVCSLPFRAFYFLSGSEWNFGTVACRLIFYIFYLNMYTSIYFLVALNIMRYLALFQPYRYKRLQKWCNGQLVCFLIWLFVAVAASPLLLLSQNATLDNAQQCMELQDNNQTIQTLIMINNTTLAVGFLLPLLIILCCSVLVAYRLWNLGSSKHMINTLKKKAFTLVIISLSVFLICLLPYHTIRTIFLYKELDVSNGIVSCESILSLRKAAVATLCLCVAHSCLDPILFFFVGENFRAFFKNVFRLQKTRAGSQQGAELQMLQT